jgi:signal peptidase II
MLQGIKRWGLLVIVVGGVLAVDQWIKRLVVEHLAIGESWEPIPAIANFIRITRSHNTGAAFGAFPWASDVFLALGIAAFIGFVFFYPRLPSHAWMSRISIALIAGGALSNAVDRLLRGHVIDYVHVQLTPTLSNISNIADHAITVGVALLLIDQWRAEQREQQEKEVMADAELDGDLESPSFDTPTLQVDDSSEKNPAAS